MRRTVVSSHVIASIVDGIGYCAVLCGVLYVCTHVCISVQYLCRYVDVCSMYVL